MTEGRKREVRRLLAAVGLPVTRLVRVRIGPIRLGRLTPGDRRELTADEVLALSEPPPGGTPSEALPVAVVGRRSSTCSLMPSGAGCPGRRSPRKDRA